ncbi:MAG: hypothetical protein WDM89_03990 [Rhizomicrobium sp.]
MRSWPNAPRCCLSERNVLERDDATGKIGDVLLCGVDNVQTLADARDSLGRLRRAVGERNAELRFQGVHLFGQRALKLRLLRDGLAELAFDLSLRRKQCVQPRIGFRRLHNRRGWPAQRKRNNRGGDNQRRGKDNVSEIHGFSWLPLTGAKASPISRP